MIASNAEYLNSLLDARRQIERVCNGRPCLNDCLRRLGGTPPPCACVGGWGAPRWSKCLLLLAALAVVLFAAFRVSAEVVCIWDGVSYVCSGEGNRVQVIGGGDGAPVVVTNFWGVCTNCVSMSPSDCEYLKSEMSWRIDALKGDVSDAMNLADVVSVFLYDQILDIDSFQRFGSPNSAQHASGKFTSFTNYVYTVENTQTELDRSFSSSVSTIDRVNRISYNDGIYDYGQQLRSSFSDQQDRLDQLSILFGSFSYDLDVLSGNVSSIDCTECQPDYQPGGSPGVTPGGGSGVLTNGNWCTYDQGEAIKDLLRDLKKWCERQHSQLVAISNYVKSAYDTLRSGLYSEYNAIPRGEDWQTLYLEGQPTGWGYDPTNTLQRIEVLLYGISGIVTNVEDNLEDTTPDAEDAADNIKTSVASVATDADGTSATTLGDAVVNFFRAFSPNARDYSGGEEILAEVQYSVGNESFYVPAVRLGSSGFLVDTMSAVKSFVSGFCSVLFWVGGAFAIFRFWVFFAGWCVKLSKWAVELCTSIFAS